MTETAIKAAIVLAWFAAPMAIGMFIISRLCRRFCRHKMNSINSRCLYCDRTREEIENL